MKIKLLLLSVISVFTVFSAFSQDNARYEIDLQNKQRVINDISQEEREIKEKIQHDLNKPPAANDDGDKNDGFKVVLHKVVVDKGGENININSNDFITSYLGRRIGKNDIFNIINKFNAYLYRQGYISSVVTLVPGNLKSGTLVLKVNWGRVSRVTVNGEAPRTFKERSLVKQLLPFYQDKILNIHDIDQMVENGNNYAKSVRVNVIPDDRHGYSVLDIMTGNNASHNYSVTFDNSGPGSSRKSGLYRYAFSANYSDLLLGSDVLNLAANTRHWFSDQGSSNYFWSGYYSFPVGNNNFSFGISNARSGQTVGSTASSYESKTNQMLCNAQLSHILYRAHQDKLSTLLELNRRRAKNYLDGQAIDVSSQPYTDFSAGLQYVTVILDAVFYSDVKYNKGSGWLDGSKSGYDSHRHPVNLERWLSNLSVNKEFQIKEQSLILNSRISMQYSKYSLIDIYRMGIGDEYSVRGYRNGNVLGDSGIVMQNTLQLPVEYFFPLQMTPFIGYDVGYMHKNEENINQLTGFSIGLRNSWHQLNGDITLGIPLTHSKGIEGVDPYSVYFNVGYQF